MKTGSMMKKVRNMANAMIIMFGGAWGTPIACRMKENTMTMNGRHVTIIAMAGTRLSTDTSKNSCIVERLRPPLAPSKTLLRPWAASGGTP